MIGGSRAMVLGEKGREFERAQKEHKCPHRQKGVG